MYTAEIDGGTSTRVINKVVHRFKLGDVEDPDIYAGVKLGDWERSEVGQWVMEHSADTPEWRRFYDVDGLGYEYIIVARLPEKAAVYFSLKWG